MDIKEFFRALLSFYYIIPLASICLFPMKNCLKRSAGATAARLFLTLMGLMLSCALLENIFKLKYVYLIFLSVLITFPIYRFSVTAHISKVLSVFFTALAYMGCFFNITICFDALLHPYSNMDSFSIEAGAFGLLLSAAAAALAYLPLSKYASRLIDRLDGGRIWLHILPASCIILIGDMFNTPQWYETLYFNRVFIAFSINVMLHFSLLFLICRMFYLITIDMLELSEMREKNYILEMQEEMYTRQAKYIEASARNRHDFKHSILILEGLAREGKLDEIRSYLENVLNALPVNDVVRYCANPAVNAILNYNKQLADSNMIKTAWAVDIPEKLSISNNDLCSMLGNILENARDACLEVPEDKRFIELYVRTDHGMILYIVASNSFNGEISMKQGRYMSTKRRGSGMGLKSIISIAEGYGGIAKFSNDDTQFMSDIMIPLE